MPHEIGFVLHAQQCVQQPRVRKINLGRLDLPFLQILVPGLHAARDQRADERVEIGIHRWRRDTKCAAEFGSVPVISVIVGKHGPESPHGSGRNRHPELRQVSFQERSNERRPPGKAVLIVPGEERRRKPAAQPESVRFVGPRFVHPQRRKFIINDPSCERFRRLTKKRGSRTAQDQKTGWYAGAVREHAQQTEKSFIALNLINDD